MSKAKHSIYSCLLACSGLLAACGGQDSGGSAIQNIDPVDEVPDAGNELAPPSESPSAGDPERGAALAQSLACSSCHASNYSGTGFYANITPDEATGIGAWSDDEIADAIVNGIDVEGEDLCALMPRAALSDGQVADLIAFLRSLPAVRNDVSELCPGHGS